MIFVCPPDGFSSEGGWWTGVLGVVSALRPVCWESTGEVKQPKSVVMEGRGGPVSALRGEWTKAMSQGQLGEKDVVAPVAFPAGVTAIGDWALGGFEALRSVVFPASCSVVGRYAFEPYGCLKAVSRPACRQCDRGGCIMGLAVR
jgi:hypothetical protein